MSYSGKKIRFFGGASASDLALPLISSAELSRLLGIPQDACVALIKAEVLPGVAIGERRYTTSLAWHNAAKTGEFVFRLKVKKESK